jgi:hypothetical protein
MVMLLIATNMPRKRFVHLSLVSIFLVIIEFVNHGVDVQVRPEQKISCSMLNCIMTYGVDHFSDVCYRVSYIGHVFHDEMSVNQEMYVSVWWVWVELSNRLKVECTFWQRCVHCNQY